MGRLKEMLLVREEDARLAGLALQAHMDATDKRAARKDAKDRRDAAKAAKAEEMKYRAERRKNATTEAELIALAREFGYQNPEYWAKHVIEGRRRRK